MRWPWLLALSLPWLLFAAWGTLALGYRLPGGPLVRYAGAAVWALFALGTLIAAWRGPAGGPFTLYAGASALLLGGWALIPPSNTRAWADDVARPLQAEVSGDVVQLHNVRNFDWRSDTDYTVRWEDRRYDLRQLRTVDIGLSYWMGPAIAHTLVSFGFERNDGSGVIDPLAFSIEIRKERHEQFSALAGFFKQYELGLVAADERDVLRVRTNVRGEDLYLYNVAMPRAAMRSLFLAYVDQARALERAPRFYNTLTANCTTLVWDMARRIVDGLPLDARLLASGYLPGYLYDLHALAPGRSLDALREAGRVTARAQAADRSPDFSQAIRQGLPRAVAAP